MAVPALDVSTFRVVEDASAGSVSQVQAILRMLGARDASRVVQLSKKQDQIEGVWRGQYEDAIFDTTSGLLRRAAREQRLDFRGVDFTPLVMRHSFFVAQQGFLSTAIAQRVPADPPRPVKLAGRPKVATMPRTLKELRVWWDRYRKGQRGNVPARQRAIAEGLRKAYVDALQKVWREHSEAFLAGAVAPNSEPVRAIREAAKVPAARAKMIAATETTHYFNNARRDVYDQSPDVTHYLFVAIRDHATTKWCKSRQGLVYKKTDPLLDKETPPIHWNCRSELLPLTPQNPRHLALIEDRGRQRRACSPEPLPAAWTGRKGSG